MPNGEVNIQLSINVNQVGKLNSQTVRNGLFFKDIFTVAYFTQVITWTKLKQGMKSYEESYTHKKN